MSGTQGTMDWWALECLSEWLAGGCSWFGFGQGWTSRRLTMVLQIRPFGNSD